MNVVRERLKELFDQALRLAGGEREEFVASLGDDKVAEELRSLLAAHDRRGPFDELFERVSGPHVERLLHLEPGDSLGHYRIVREIASGGMAIVYEAEDVRHDREVAIKVLRPELAALLGADRFVREMKTTAKLQHPHILPLFDSGEAEGLLYYVMPYVEGETLRERLIRDTQLSVEEAVQITTQVAEALDYAHKHDVIHRDIKPGNILLQEGRPLVSDFGIALALSTVAGERTTEAGVPLGTPHYMSPEQAAAEKDLTHRSDIYSLGCVLYETLTGEPPHTGASAGQVIRSIVADEVRSVTELRKTVPPNVAAALARSLEKLPADRFESAAAFARALADPNYTSPATRPRRQERGRRLAVGLTVVATVAILAGVWGWLRPVARHTDRRVVEFQLAPPESALSFGPNLVLSPDGRRLVVEAYTGEGSVLYQRTLDSPDWHVIPATEGAYGPFFSPDGAWVGFKSTRDNTIKRVPAEGGAVYTISTIKIEAAELGWGASWGPDNTIVFPSPTEGTYALFGVPAAGGVPAQLTFPDRELGEVAHSSPHHLQGGDVILFRINRGVEQSVAALSLQSGRVEELVPGMRPHGLSDGRVAWATTEGYVVAQAFDPRTMTLRGSPRKITEGINISYPTASYTIAADGSLAYKSRPGVGNQFLLVGRDGKSRPLYSPDRGSSLALPRYSPSGDRIAFLRSEGTDIVGDVWVYTLRDSTARQLSFGGPASDPAWTCDGRSIGYSAWGSSGTADLYLRAADGTGPVEQILQSGDHLWQMDFAPGDSEIVFFKTDNIFRASLVGDSVPVPLMETGYTVTDPALSKDGRWLAYKSNESGLQEVYVRSYPDMGPPTAVSVGGGEWPAWSADGSEIFYWGRGRMMAASVRYQGSRITVDRRVELFRVDAFRRLYVRNYAVHPSGQEFVLVGDTDARIVWRVNALAGEE